MQNNDLKVQIIWSPTLGWTLARFRCSLLSILELVNYLVNYVDNYFLRLGIETDDFRVRFELEKFIELVSNRSYVL